MEKRDEERTNFKIYQLTGYSDDIYIEGLLEIHQYDLVLNINLVNRTEKTFPNVHLELLTLGSLKLILKPLTVNLGPMEVQKLKSTLKVFSTEVGGIYGYLNYEKERATTTMVQLNGIELDFMDELHPGTCSEQ
jgi:coatomer subunit beta